MKKLTIFLTQILACGLLAAPSSAQFIPQATAIPGSAPEGINYQGRLEDGGFPVNATKSMIFRVYSAPVGGVLLWTSPAQAVTVALGLFSAVVPVPTTVLVGGGARYLEVQIDSTLMAPRELLNSVPYALIAKSVEGNIDVSTAGLAINANSTAVQPALYISSVTGNVGVGTGAPVTVFDVGGSAAFGSAATKSTFTAAGGLLARSVSIGTGTAGTLPLHVVQTVGGTAMAHFENTGANSVLEVGATGSLIQTTNQIDSRFVLAPSGVSGFGVTNHDYGALGLGSAGLFSAVTSGGSTINGGIRELYFFTNNDFSAPKMHITSGGRVGVGTALPASKLHLSSGTLIIDGNAATSLTTTGNVGIGTASPDKTLNVFGTANNFVAEVWNQGTVTSSNGLYVHSTNADPATMVLAAGNLSVMGDGKVGIGTTSPGAALDVAGHQLFSVAGASITFNAGGPTIGVPTGNTLAFGTSGIERMRLDNLGNFGIGTTGPGHQLQIGTHFNGSVANAKIFVDAGAYNAWNGKIAVSPDGNAAVASVISSYHDNTLNIQKLGLGTIGYSGVEQTMVLQDGKVGIRTETPANPLQVSLPAGSGTPYVAVNQTADNPYLELQRWTGAALDYEGIRIKGIVGSGGILAFETVQNGGAPIGSQTFTERMRIQGNNVGIGTGSSTPADRLEVAGGNVRLTAVAGTAGSVKLFSALTVGAVTCTAQCGANTFCLAAWDSAGTASTCGTAAADNRCLCSGFGN